MSFLCYLLFNSLLLDKLVVEEMPLPIIDGLERVDEWFGALWRLDGLKWAAKARITRIIDLRFPSRISNYMKKNHYI